MSLIELYIQEVIRRLPDKQREDIALELHSTIEDMLPDDYSEEEVKSVLSKLGNPAVLASGYLDRPMHLIGPRYYDVYINLLIMILPIALSISFITLLVENLVSYSWEKGVINLIQLIIAEGIENIIGTGMQVFFWLTIVFAILERTDKSKNQHPLSAHLKEWTPEDLKSLHHLPKGKGISKIEVFSGLLWTAIWATAYFNVGNLVGVYEKKDGVLKFITPTFNQDVLHSYWIIVGIVIVLEVVMAIYKMIARQWTKKLALFNAFYQIIAACVFLIMISNADLFNQSFITYMNDLFSFHDNWPKIFLIITGITVVVFAINDSYQGFRKARIKHFTK